MNRLSQCSSLANDQREFVPCINSWDASRVATFISDLRSTKLQPRRPVASALQTILVLAYDNILLIWHYRPDTNYANADTCYAKYSVPAQQIRTPTIDKIDHQLLPTLSLRYIDWSLADHSAPHKPQANTVWIQRTCILNKIVLAVAVLAKYTKVLTKELDKRLR